MITDIFIAAIYVGGIAGAIKITWHVAPDMGNFENFCFSVIFCGLGWPIWLPYYLMTEVDF